MTMALSRASHAVVLHNTCCAGKAIRVASGDVANLRFAIWRPANVRFSRLDWRIGKREMIEIANIASCMCACIITTGMAPHV